MTINESLVLLAIYTETNSIWFSDFYHEEEESMYKLIGVSKFVLNLDKC